ncbi:MAG: radical SAM family heme chaperone HemW [Phycisphaerae bacterium]
MSTTGLYVHVPFCSGKCFYCDFYSIPAEPLLVENYLQALECEAKLVCEKYFDSPKPKVETIYFGGGTPTSLAIKELAELGRIVESNFSRAANCEFTSEANPESVTAGKIQKLREVGLNRFSMGGQTFNDEFLQVIGRRHTSRQTIDAVELAIREGIRNISLDLIYALPNESLEQYKKDLETAVKLPIRHVSCYELTYEPQTKLFPLRANAIDPAEEEKQVAMFLLGHELLTAAGFEHYEISNYAKSGHRCRHNIHYWKNLDYIGLGPSAAGFLKRNRYKNVSDLKEYCRRLLDLGELPVESEEVLSDLRFAGETAMLALRTASGIAKKDFTEQTGYDPVKLFKKQIEKFTALELLATDNERIFLMPTGMILSNEVLAEFLQS